MGVDFEEDVVDGLDPEGHDRPEHEAEVRELLEEKLVEVLLGHGQQHALGQGHAGEAARRVHEQLDLPEERPRLEDEARELVRKPAVHLDDPFEHQVEVPGRVVLVVNDAVSWLGAVRYFG